MPDPVIFAAVVIFVGLFLALVSLTIRNALMQVQSRRLRQRTVAALGGELVEIPKIITLSGSRVIQLTKQQWSWLLEIPDLKDVPALITLPSVKHVPFMIHKVDWGATKMSFDEETQAFEQLSQLKITDSDAPKKENINVVSIGHVDAGKSTLGGHLLYLTGMVDKRTLEKFEKESKEMGRESWFYSWALDTGNEEREKGITVECGQAFFETDKRRYTLLDAPGHKNYVPSMISGANQADVALLVISARKGEFETGFEKGGQTREHATLVKTAGVKKLIVVVNKMDEPTVKWDKTRYDEIVDKVTPFLKQCGFNTKTDVFFMPVSGFTGANLKDPMPQNVCPWYDGPSLLQYLDNMPSIDRRLDGPFLMPISGKFREMGTVITGKIESGRVAKGDTILIMPNKVSVEILTINIEDAEVRAAESGDNVRLRVKGIEEEDVMVGFVACSSSSPVKATTAFQAQLVILNIKSIMAPGFKAVLHIHACSEEVVIESFENLIDKKTGEKIAKKPFVRQGDIVIANLSCQGVVCLEPFSVCDPMGRFTLRDEGKTIAVGKVLKPLETVD